jgi:hypothetical protein
METPVSCRFLQVFLLVLVGSTFLFSQNQSSDPQAVALAQQSVAVLTGGTTISDVTLNANVTSTLGSDNETGTATLKGKGPGESRVDLNLSGGTRSDVRNVTSGSPAGAWEKNGNSSTAYAFHNCWTNASWFFPALSSLSQTANPSFIFKYIGQEQQGGFSMQHIQVYQVPAQGPKSAARLSLMDFYLDSTSYLPLAIGFKVHPDNEMTTDIPVEIAFADYRAVGGIQVPFHFQRSFNGGVVLDVNVTSAVFNSGLPDSLFTLP